MRSGRSGIRVHTMRMWAGLLAAVGLALAIGLTPTAALAAPSAKSADVSISLSSSTSSASVGDLLNNATESTTVTAAERIPTHTGPTLGTAVPCFACGFHSYTSAYRVTVHMKVVATDGSVVNAGTVTFRDDVAYGVCSAPVIAGSASCSYDRTGGSLLVSGGTSYSGSSTYAPSSSQTI